MQDAELTKSLPLEICAFSKKELECLQALQLIQVTEDPLTEVVELKCLVFGAPIQLDVVTHATVTGTVAGVQTVAASKLCPGLV